MKYHKSLDKLIYAGISYKEGLPKKAARLLAEAMEEDNSDEMLKDLNEANTAALEDSEEDEESSEDSAEAGLKAMAKVLANRLTAAEETQDDNSDLNGGAGTLGDIGDDEDRIAEGAKAKVKASASRRAKANRKTLGIDE